MRPATLLPRHEGRTQPSRKAPRAPWLVALAVGASLFAVAYDAGGYSVADRATLGIAAVWTVVLALALGLWPLEPVPRLAIVAGGLIAAYAALAGISIAWSDSAENAYAELARDITYLAVFAIAVLASRRIHLGSWLDGLALFVAGVAVVAFLSRLAPGLVGAERQLQLLPSAETRLSFPLGYWNGLAILLGLGVPLVLRTAVVARSAVWRGLGLAAAPVVAASMYLTSSRGGVATLVLATFTFLVLTSRRTAALGATCVATAGSAAAIAFLLRADAFVDGPIGSAAADDQAPRVGAAVAISCLVTGVAWGAGTALVSGLRSSRRLDRAALAIVVVVAVAAVAALNPVGRFEDFKNPVANYSPDYVRSHLLSSSGSGRWQFWEAAVDAFRDAPLTGQGAGAYEAWWAQHGSLAQFVRDAHSLYLESLAELGAPGGLLVVLALGTGLYGLATRVFRASGETRVSVAAAGGAYVGFVVAAGIDWMWELTVVPCVGLVLLGLLTGPASAPLRRARGATPAVERPRGPWRGYALAALVVGWGLMILLAIPLLAELQLGDSRAAAARGQAGEALKSATRASQIEPWAASPYLQIALIEEQAGRLRPARRAIHRAIDRSPNDWHLWYIAARIETKLGEIRSAKASFARARSLNPRSTIFSQPPT